MIDYHCTVCRPSDSNRAGAVLLPECWFKLKAYDNDKIKDRKFGDEKNKGTTGSGWSLSFTKLSSRL